MATKIKITLKPHIADSTTLRPMKHCTGCKRDQPASGFVSLAGKPTTRCATCLEKSRRHEATRAPRIRSYKEYDNRPERKVVKKKWREENRAKCAEYWMKYRAKKIENDIDGYLARNAANMRVYRLKHPEYCKKLNEQRRNSPKVKIGVYKRSARIKGIEWQLADDDARNLLLGDCYYCGKSPGEGVNGIDRMDNSVGYQLDNVCSCCSECNYSKSSMSALNYIAVCIHIAIHNKLHEGKTSPTIFPSIKGAGFASYKTRANKKALTFALTYEEFNDLISSQCYLCGVKYPHDIGIDRVDNDEGYISSNCKPCCNTCNMLKREYTLDSVLERCAKIAKLHQHVDVDGLIPEKHVEYSGRTKLTGGDLQNLAMERRDTRIKRYQETICNTKYRKQHALNLTLKTDEDSVSLRQFSDGVS